MKAHHFVRLKLRLTANGLRGQSWRVVMFVLGALFGLFGAFTGYIIFCLPGLLEKQRAAEIVTPLGGALIVLSWLFVPLLLFGVDESLDPARFALLPLRRPTLIKGLLVASLVGLPALATFVATLGVVHAAARLGGPAAALTALAGVASGLLLCVAISRAVTSAFATALRSRRARDLATVLLAGTTALIGPLQIAALAGAQYADWGRFGVVADVVAWTPFGAPYSVGLDVAAGRAWAVPVKFVMVLATLGVLLWWWSATVEKAMLGAAGAGGARQRAASRRGAVAELVPRWLPANRFGALTAREVRYWWRETRRRASLITFFVIGVFLPVFVTLGSESSTTPTGMLIFVGALAAATLANQFGFEGSAYAANVVAGVPGRVELTSRVAGFTVYAGPALVAITLVVGGVTNRPQEIPALFGTLVAAFAVGLAIVLPVSVGAAYPLPDTVNPFAMSSGGGMAKGLLSIGALFGTALATAPLLLGSWLLGDAWLWLGLPIGVGYGAAAFAIGLRLTGPMLDRRMPELLATVSAAQ
ncbi:ABC transporter permease [Actinoplanes sp. NPDC051346]|uniref:ABC transporter permease n=1 Tax=Actinoplanes sp. NPDC051346 TaxID=3155048 RepID=UPI00342C1E85